MGEKQQRNQDRPGDILISIRTAAETRRMFYELVKHYGTNRNTLFWIVQEAHRKMFPEQYEQRQDGQRGTG